MNQNVKLDKKINPLMATTHSLSHDGRGIATVNHKTTFISGALANETVFYKIIKKHRTYDDAEALEIVTPCAQRTTPPCQHFGICGGCSLQHMGVESQIQLKQHTLLEQLNHFGKVTPEFIMVPLHANSVGYRRKARLGVRYVIKKNKLLVGFREKASRYLADLDHCVTLHPKVGERLPLISQLIASLEQYQAIPQIEVAVGDPDVALVIRHLNPLSVTDKTLLTNFASEHSFHIYLQPNPPAPIEKLWPADNHHRLTYSLPDHGLEFLFHPLDFTQINLEMNRLMINQAIQLLELKPDDSVLDLFCGIGNFTLPISKQVKHVTGIEGSEEMVKRAQDNALHNHILNTTFYAADLMQASSQAQWSKTSYDKILLDPPRAGAKEILPIIQRLNAKKIVYISCNPATLARDAGELVHQHGYRLKQAGIMNMFPHTSHIEAIAVFDKLKG